jgi:hypothetical protein
LHFFAYFQRLHSHRTSGGRSFYPDNVSYNPAIPKPEDIIGHSLGHRVARHDLLIQYLRTVAEKSDRVNVETIAQTHEGRDILMLTISSPENLTRIDEIKAAHVALSDPNSTQQVSDDMPVVTWLNYGVWQYHSFNRLAGKRAFKY